MTNLSKYALVTGASSGIGWQISKELAKRGYTIVAVSNQSNALEQLKQTLEAAHGIEVIPFEINLALSDAAKQVFAFCENHAIQIEVLVNNAGMLIFGDAVKVEYDKAATLLQLHMTTPALLCRLFGEQMRERKNGYILNVSSISAVMPYPTISFYGPSKSFIRDFTRALHSELKPHNVKVTCLLPGATSTALFNDFDVNRKLAMKLGVMKTPEYVAEKAVNALFKGKAERIPGWMNKLTMVFIPLVPHFIINAIYRSYSRKQG